MLRQKFLLVLFAVLVNVTPIMKRLFTLIVLLGLTVGVLSGCNQGETPKPADTNAAPAAPTAPAAPGTNATK